VGGGLPYPTFWWVRVFFLAFKLEWALVCKKKKKERAKKIAKKINESSSSHHLGLSPTLPERQKTLLPM
jgi:hypothetical protein